MNLYEQSYNYINYLYELLYINYLLYIIIYELLYNYLNYMSWLHIKMSFKKALYRSHLLYDLYR